MADKTPMRINRYHLIGIYLLLQSVAAMAISVPKCPAGRQSIEEQFTLIHKVVILGSDDRKPIRSKEHSEVGTLWCAGGMSTAQLSGSDGVITAAAHSFYDKDCKLLVTKNQPCHFQPPGSNRLHEVDIDSLKAGCPRPKENDWAVAKLKQPVRGASFLQIPPKEMALNPGDTIRQVSIRSDATGSRIERFSQDCKIREMHAAFRGAVAFHDCDTEPSASGGAQIMEFQGQNYLMAIHVGGKVNETLKRSNNSSVGEYDGRNYRNTSLTVTGKFREALEELTRTTTSKLGQ